MLHGWLDLPALYRGFDDMPVVSISDAQRMPVEHPSWQATIYHGLLETLYRFNLEGGDYFAFLGCISPEKRVDWAIEIARRTDTPLKIAAKVDPVDQAYFDAEIASLLEGPRVEFLGEITEGQKNDFLGEAAALLFPIDWPEPFGLVTGQSHQISPVALNTDIRRCPYPQRMRPDRSRYGLQVKLGATKGGFLYQIHIFIIHFQWGALSALKKTAAGRGRRTKRPKSSVSKRSRRQSGE